MIEIELLRIVSEIIEAKSILSICDEWDEKISACVYLKNSFYVRWISLSFDIAIE